MPIDRCLARLAAVATLLCSVTATAATPQHGYTPFGELKYPPDFEHFHYVNPDAPKGGTLTLMGHGSFDSLNPWILPGRSPGDTPGLFIFGFLETPDTLLMGTRADNRLGDEPRSAYGLIAESLACHDELDWCDFFLRQAARFHDGHPITAEDVVFSFDTLRQQGHPRYGLQLSGVDRVEALSKRRVRFHFSGDHRRNLPLAVGELPILPAHYWAEHDFTAATLDPPLLSGPYRVAEVKPGRSVTLERVADYWGKDLPVNKGRYNFDKVVIDYYRDAQVAFEGFKAGEYDLHYDYIAKHWATAYDFPALNDGKVRRAEIPHRIAQGTQAFFFNLRRDKFQDRRVRQALGMLFDFQWTNKVIFNGAYKRSDTWFPNSANAATGVPDKAEKALLAPWREQLPEALFSEPFSLPESDGSGRIREHQRQALALLREAGWKLDNQKLVNQSGEPLKLEILNYHSAAMERVIMPWIKNMSRLGIDASYREVDPATYKQRLDDFDFDVTIFVLPQNAFPGPELFDYVHSRSADLAGSRNYAGINDPVVDALVEKTLAATGEAEYRTAIQALDRVLLWRHYSIPHWYIDYHRVAWWDRFARPEAETPYTLGIPSWWSKDKQ
jgi:microcin C transport system substrate-binding protein